MYLHIAIRNGFTRGRKIPGCILIKLKKLTKLIRHTEFKRVYFQVILKILLRQNC